MERSIPKIWIYVVGFLQSCGLIGVSNDIWLARQYKRKIMRGDIVSDRHIEVYKTYKSHPMVKDYKW